MSEPGIAANAIVTGVRPAGLGAGILALAGPTHVREDGQWKKQRRGSYRVAERC
ncbi:MAG TPA: hypothetical protein VF934_03820 [Burkholderiales bacterium]